MASQSESTTDPTASIPEAEPIPTQVLPPTMFPTGGEGSSVAGNMSDLFLNNLDVDSNDTDVDSAISDIYNASSTASVRSSVYNYVEENGRTYHKYKEGKYLLPNDAIEQERLDLQHHLWLLMLKNKLYLAPISNPQRVLDVGTGTGIWAIDFANQHPSASVIGTDLSPIQPIFVPPNCRFEVDDVEDDWTYEHKFDFVHGRLLFSIFSNGPGKFVQNAYDALAPGGYMEVHESDSTLYGVDDTYKGTALAKWTELLCDGAKALGKDWHCALRYKQSFIDAGFEDVVERRFPAPIGPWPKDKAEKLVGLYWTANLLDGISGISNRTLRNGLGMSSEEVELLLVDVRRDLKDRRIHSYVTMVVVTGRKPK